MDKKLDLEATISFPTEHVRSIIEAARDNSARRGLRKLFARIVPFVLLYWMAVMFLTAD